VPDQPSNRPELTSGTGATRPTVRQIWTRSLIIAAVFGLFVAVGFGRWESARILTIFIVATLIALVILGGLFTWLNREAVRR
jgi:hypothetical protein